jgi:hypothetical protein
MNINEAFPSPFFKAGDLPGGVLRARIKNVKREMVGKDERPVMTFDGQSKSLPLNKTNFAACADAFGSAESNDWTGKEIELVKTRVLDPQGRLVDGVRLRQPQPPPREPGPSATSAGRAQARQETAPKPVPPPSVYDDLDDLIPDEDPFAPEVKG